MPKKKLTTQGGFTLVGLMIATVLVLIPLFGVSVVLVDNQRGWHDMYDRIHSDIVADGYIARKVFDAAIRKASWERVLLDDAGNWVEVRYYQDADSPVVDRYIRFYETDGRLNIEYGRLNPRETLTTQTICENVSSCVFKGDGRSAQMILTLDNGSRIITVASSAVMHNQ